MATVARELYQQHPRDFLSDAGTSRGGNTIITWLNNFAWNLYQAKYVQNVYELERRLLLASIVTP